MSDEFRKFSDAARLYAKYEAVVDEMWELFKADISAFLNAVRDRVQSQARTGKLSVEETNVARSWWIEDDAEEDDTEDDYDVPYIWFRTQLSQIVTPGVLALGVYGDGSLKPYHQQLAAMLSETQLPPMCRKAATSGGEFFAATISYGDSDDPVRIAAEPVLILLTALHDAEQKLRKIPKSGPT